ncbi:MAG: hypothetical protein ACYDER_13465 [Ktedonobacteraceae bacterium]
MKRLIIRSVALVACIIAIGAFALFPWLQSSRVHGVHAAGGPRAVPVLVPDTTTFRPFVYVPIAAHGFAPNDTVLIFLDNTNWFNQIDVLKCGPQGNCDGKVMLPYYPISGYQLLIARDTNGLTAQTLITIVANIAVYPHSGGPNAPIQLAGAAFSPNETLKVYWGTPKTGILEGTPTTDMYDGNFKFTFTAPSGTPPGVYPITVVRSLAKQAVLMTQYTLKVPVMKVLTPGLRSGKPLKMLVSGFQSSEQVTLSWNANGGQNLITDPTDQDGKGSIAVIPPSAPPGTYTLTVTGNSSGLQATGTVAVGPGIAPNTQYVYDGETITVTGSGFSANESIGVFFQNPSNGVITITSDTNGDFTVQLTLPVHLPRQSFFHVYARATSNTEQARARVIFQVPYAILDNQYASFGGTNTAYGQSFAPGETVKLIWNYHQPGQVLIGTVTADSNGTFVFPFIVPSDPNLSNVTFAAVGLSSRLPSTSPVTEYPALFLLPTSGPDGTTVSVSAGGYDAGETVTVSFHGQSVGTATSDKTGAISTSFVLPQATGPGLFEVDGRGATSQIDPSANFAVIPGETISPNTGPSNTSITVTGDSFLANETVTIYWYDPNFNMRYTLGTVTTTNTGTFETQVTAPPNLISGDIYYVQSVDQQGSLNYYGQAVFTAQ